jgi:hypothetical protein
VDRLLNEGAAIPEEEAISVAAQIDSVYGRSSRT